MNYFQQCVVSDRVTAPDMKFPSVVSIVGHRHSGVVSHHVVVYREDGLAVRPEPGHLVPL